MANQKSASNSTKPKVVITSVTDLVRINLKGLLSNRQTDIAINNAFIDAYENWEKTRKEGVKWKFTHPIPSLNRKKRNVEEWSQKSLAKALNVDIAIIRKIFEPKRSKGSGRLTVDEVVELALVFNVTPGYLMQPLREHLEGDVPYMIESVRPSGMTVSARDWLLWVHGISTADGSSSRGLEQNLMSLTPEIGMDINSKRRFWPHDELDRVAAAQYVSPISAMLESQSNPVPGHLMSDAVLTDDKPLDLSTRAKSAISRYHARTKYALAYMQHVRQAFRMVDREFNQKYVRQDIEWCLNRMREDLTRIAANHDAVSKEMEK
jgi:transcriptional regulator with XRE-family HTH domain